ncbi:hypothetical protein AGR6A_Lc120044 [Agrobacterium sp. NCPPB 925]|nr:hypothetical protein AGR6A_Lc120044 [Agrobacterium sp. NCPPB 925]
MVSVMRSFPPPWHFPAPVESKSPLRLSRKPANKLFAQAHAFFKRICKGVAIAAINPPLTLVFRSLFNETKKLEEEGG